MWEWLLSLLFSPAIRISYLLVLMMLYLLHCYCLLIEKELFCLICCALPYTWTTITCYWYEFYAIWLVCYAINFLTSKFIIMEPLITAIFLWNINFWIPFLLLSFFLICIVLTFISGFLDWSEMFHYCYCASSLLVWYLSPCSLSVALKQGLILINCQLWKETIFIVIVTHDCWISDNTWLGSIVCIVLTLCICILPLVCTALRCATLCFDCFLCINILPIICIVLKLHAFCLNCSFTPGVSLSFVYIIT